MASMTKIYVECKSVNLIKLTADNIDRHFYMFPTHLPT